MPKEKQTRKQWIAKIRRDVGPYFKVTFFGFWFCFFVDVVVVFFFSKDNTISGLVFMLLSARHVLILTLLYINIYR